MGNITLNEQSSSAKFDDEEEDLIEKDKRDEMERLRKQGIRQQKLEAIRKEEEERFVSCPRLTFVAFSNKPLNYMTVSATAVQCVRSCRCCKA